MFQSKTIKAKSLALLFFTLAILPACNNDKDIPQALPEVPEEPASKPAEDVVGTSPTKANNNAPEWFDPVEIQRLNSRNHPDSTALADSLLNKAMEYAQEHHKAQNALN